MKKNLRPYTIYLNYDELQMVAALVTLAASDIIKTGPGWKEIAIPLKDRLVNILTKNLKNHV